MNPNGVVLSRVRSSNSVQFLTWDAAALLALPLSPVPSSLALARAFGSTCSVNVGEGSAEGVRVILSSGKPGMGLDSPGGSADETWMTGTMNGG